MKNVLVTGCAGFIGSNIAEELTKQGWNVIGIDNLITGYIKNIENLLDKPNFKFIWADIRDFQSLKDIFNKNEIDYVCHQAARGSVPKSVEDPNTTMSINVTGTLNLLTLSQQFGIKRFVFASSSAIYGNTPTLPKTETMEYQPLSPYAVSKVCKEMLASNFYSLYGLETIGLRYFNVYGRRQDPQGDYAAVIPKWITNAKQNKPLFLTKNGDQSRDFTYIDDVVNANILALTSNNREILGKSVNIAYQDRVFIKELADTIINETKSLSKVEMIDARKGDIKDSYADITRAKQWLDYQPKTDIQAGILKTIEFYT